MNANRLFLMTFTQENFETITHIKQEMDFFINHQKLKLEKNDPFKLSLDFYEKIKQARIETKPTIALMANYLTLAAFYSTVRNYRLIAMGSADKIQIKNDEKVMQQMTKLLTGLNDLVYSFLKQTKEQGIEFNVNAN